MHAATLPRVQRTRDNLTAYLCRLRALQAEAIALGFTQLGSQFDEPIAAAKMALQRAE